ncbi:MAG: L-lactate dehydrogenase [Candidatus Euphemobacter frigidus]|nr:L-lactate dehydrogenase [Candidatus Euphemobacter frigidus]MDP8276646.1 L-lactate dehydrogenase [Candidatus Euphemobacter frigidus]
MNGEHWKARKVVVVGTGAVGSTFAYALAQSGLAEEIVLLDKNRELMEGNVLDLAHGTPFFPTVRISCGEEKDYRDAQVIVITAGAKQQPGESRLQLLRKNSRIIEQIVISIADQNSPAVIILVSNPVDILTYVALKKSGLPRGRVIGSGTMLDSARFRYLLSRHCGIDPHSVHAYILGEHGDSEFAVWSMTNIAGIPIDEYCPTCGRCTDWNKEREEIVEEVRQSAYHIIDYKGATFYGIGQALVQIVGTILRNRRSVLTVSTLLDGEYGLSNVCLSVPCIVSRKGAELVIEGRLFDKELKSLRNSAEVLQEALSELHLVKP